MSARVTLVTVYYNRSAFVDHSMASLRDQTYSDLKVIAVDDGSPDDTLQRLEKFKDARIEVRGQANRGFTPTMRSIFDAVDTEFVAVHGSGDISHPTRIAAQVAALDQNPGCVMAAVTHQTIDPLTGESLGARRSGSDSVLKRGDIAFTTPFTHGTVMYRTEAYRRAGGYEPLMKWCSDWDLWFRMLRLGDAIVVGEVLYDRLAQADGVSFHPKKSIEQVKYKRIAQKLSRLDDTGRTELLEVLGTSGLDAAVASESSKVTLDLARREAKLALMGRTEAAKELRALARSESLDSYPILYKALLAFAPVVSRSGVSPDRLISLGRSVFSRRREK